MATQAQQITALQSQVAQLQAQEALTVQALAAFLAGNFDGAGSAKAYLLAIAPGLQVTPASFVLD